MLRAKTRWEQKPIDEDAVTQLAKKLNKDRLIISLCWLRGLRTVEEIERFLEPEKQSFYDPFLLIGMQKAVDRIRSAIANHENVLVYGDYDADGVTSTTILYYLFKQLNANFNIRIPDRFQDGYGLNANAIRQAAEEGVSLIVTVDTGISAYDEVELANDLGIDVIITDHHEPPAQVPNAYAVINPKQEDCTYPYPYLCGAGVAIKLVEAMLGFIPEHFLALAAIGTIADLVPLLDENRLIAIRGLQALSTIKNVGIKALLKVSGIEGGFIDSAQVGFAIGPRINAAGRLAHASVAVRLLTTEDEGEAEQLAKELNRLNQERQELVRMIAEAAEQEALQQIASGNDTVLVVAGADWHEGVIGIVASKLVERFYRPTIVLSIDPEKGEAKGSARSIEGFDLYENLTQCKELLRKYGGHTMAAGLSIQVDQIEALRNKLNVLGKQILTPELLMPKMDIDLTCNVADITLSLLEQIARLAPYGVNNPEPKVRLRDVEVVSQRKVGSNGDHVKWVLQQDDAKIDAIGFGFGEFEKYITLRAPLQIVAEIGINEWNGTRKPQLMVRDLAIHERQIFDYRGRPSRLDFLQQFTSEQPPLLLYFRKENEEHLAPFLQSNKYCIVSMYGCSESDFSEACALDDHLDRISDVILYDLPTNYRSLQQLRRLHKADRIWLLFGMEMNQSSLSKIPDRDTFKWFYSYLLQNKMVALDDKIWEIVKWKRIQEAEIRFMVQVFKELEFIHEQDGKLSVLASPKKRTFEESLTYQTEKERIEVEQELLFSSTEAISKWFSETGDIKREVR